jgi:hypothetical protein
MAIELPFLHRYMPSVDMMPVISEPLFQMGAKVEFHPAMNMEELKKGLSAAIK